MEAQELYRIYWQGLARLGVESDSWGDIEEKERAAWEYLAQQLKERA